MLKVAMLLRKKIYVWNNPGIITLPSQFEYTTL